MAYFQLGDAYKPLSAIILHLHIVICNHQKNDYIEFNRKLHY